MKKYLTMIGNIALFVSTLYAIIIIHNLTVYKIKPYQNFIHANIAVYTAIALVITILMYVLIFRIKQRMAKDPRISFISTLRINKISGSNILLLIGMGIAGWLFSIGLIDLELTAKYFPSLQQMIDEFMQAEYLLLAILCAGIIMPIFEEILFRGLIFNELRKHLPLITAVLIQAVLYAMFQPSLILSFISLFSGTIYCILYYKMNSIVAPILVQITAMTMIYITDQAGFHQFFLGLGQPALWVMTIVSLVALFGATFYVWKKEPSVDETANQQAHM